MPNCNHEEADTKTVVYVQHVSFTTVVVHNRDRPCFSKPLIEHTLEHQQEGVQQMKEKP